MAVATMATMHVLSIFSDTTLVWWILAHSWVVSSALCWSLGRWLNRGLPIRVLGYRSIHDSHTDGHTIFVFRLEFGGIAALPIHILVAVYGPQFLDR